MSEGVSFLVISVEAEKINAFAFVTDEAQTQGLKANSWITATLSSLGGRGGGKAGQAQGSAAAPRGDADVTAAVNEAKKFLVSVH